MFMKTVMFLSLQDLCLSKIALLFRGWWCEVELGLFSLKYHFLSSKYQAIYQTALLVTDELSDTLARKSGC